MDTFNPKIQEKISNVLEAFDFDQVRSVLDVLNIDYPLSDGSVGLPSISDLEADARTVLLNAMENPDYDFYEGLLRGIMDSESRRLTLEFVPVYLTI